MWSEIEQRVAGRGFRDEDLAEQLGVPVSTAGGVPAPVTREDNLSYIKTVLIARGHRQDDDTPIPNTKLPNPLTWTAAATAYAILQQRYPEHASQKTAAVAKQWNDDVALGGSEVATFLRTLLRCKKLFGELIDAYLQHLEQLGGARPRGCAVYAPVRQRSRPVGRGCHARPLGGPVAAD